MKFNFNKIVKKNFYILNFVYSFFFFIRSNNGGGGSTPHGGPPSYNRNPQSISESLPVPSVGSPASVGQSPMPNSTLSQPTSVPPSDQVY